MNDKPNGLGLLFIKEVYSKPYYNTNKAPYSNLRSPIDLVGAWVNF